MSDDRSRPTDLRQDELEAMRADVVAHVRGLPRSERQRLHETIVATLARIDARLEQLGAGGAAGPLPADDQPQA